MNIYLLIIIIAITGNFLLHSIARWLNLKNLKLDLPGEFEGYYEPDQYQKSQQYFQTGARFAFVTAAFDLILSLGFIFLGGFNYLDIFVRQFAFSELTNGLLYFGILFLLYDLISLPFSIYSTFVIEERFGFNKTTWKTFLIDKVKGYVLIVILGGLIMSVILWFFENAGSLAWLYAWLIVTAFSIILQPLYINFIAPLFNKFTPLDDSPLKDAILDFTTKVNFPLKGLFIMDGSKRSSHSNAYFTGFGKSKRIVLYDTLLDKHSQDEIVAILAHEVGHYKLKHIIQGLITGIIHTGILFALISLFMGNQQLFAAFQMEHISIYASLIFFSLLYTPIELVISVIMNAVSRKHEFQADKFAAVNTSNPEAMITALKNLSVSNLGNLYPHRLSVILNADHPPVMDRIAALRSI